MKHLSGTKLGEYELLWKLDQGSEGAVFLARDSEDTEVAVKVYFPHLYKNASSKRSLTKHMKY